MLWGGVNPYLVILMYCAIYLELLEYSGKLYTVKKERNTMTDIKDKTTTVAQLIEFLQTQDQGAEVSILRTSTFQWETVIEKVNFDPSEHADYTDLRGNPFCKDDNPNFGKRFLFLGSEE